MFRRLDDIYSGIHIDSVLDAHDLPFIGILKFKLCYHGQDCVLMARGIYTGKLRRGVQG